jgi:hypothetical protein
MRWSRALCAKYEAIILNFLDFHYFCHIRLVFDWECFAPPLSISPRVTQIILWHNGQIWKVACREQCGPDFSKNWKCSGLTNSFWGGIIFHQTIYVWLGVCKNSGRSIGGGKKMDSDKVPIMHTWQVQQSWKFMKNRVFQGVRAPKSANSLRWRESPPEVIRRDGFPLNSKSNTMAQRANLEGRLPWTMWARFFENLKMLWIDQFVLRRNNFPSNNICMAWCMQKLRSLHRRRKKNGLRQGSNHAHVASSAIMKIHEKSRFPGS